MWLAEPSLSSSSGARDEPEPSPSLIFVWRTWAELGKARLSSARWHPYAEDEAIIKDPDTSHSPDQRETEGPSRDHDTPLGEESSAEVMDLDLPSSNLTSPALESSETVSSKGFESILFNAPTTETLKIPIEPLSSESLSTTVLAQPSLEMSRRLAQLLFRAKLFTSGVTGITMSSSFSSPSPLPLDQLQQALAMLQSCFMARPSAVLLDPAVNATFVNSSNFLLQCPGYIYLWINELVFI